MEFTTSEACLSRPTSIYLTTDKTCTRVAEIGNDRGTYRMHFLASAAHLLPDVEEALRKFAADYITMLNVKRRLLK